MTTMTSATTMPYGPRRALAVLDHLIAQVQAGEARWLANAALARLSDERLTRLRASRWGLLADSGRQRVAGSAGGMTPVADDPLP